MRPTTSVRTLVLIIVAGGCSLFGQSVSFGVKGGVRATSDFEYAATSESRRYVVGPMAALTLPFRLGIEFDALYRRMGYSASWSTPLYSSSTRESDNAWEFPILGSYRLPLPGAEPFVEAGWAPRVVHGSGSINGKYLSNANTGAFTSYTQSLSGSWPTTQGVVLGGGIRISVGRFQLSPELRYTHWNKPAITGQFADGPSYNSTQNQVDIFLGISSKVWK